MDGIKKPEDTSTPPPAPLPPAGENLESNPPQPAPADQPVVSAPQPAPDAAQTVNATPAGKVKTWMIVGVLVLVAAVAGYLVFA